MEVLGLVEGRFDDDEAAAAHYRVMSHEVHPWSSLFLTDTGVVGGSTEMAARMQAAGAAPPTDRQPDHLAAEVAFVAHLLRHRPASLPSFLDDHLLRWLLPVTDAIQAADPNGALGRGARLATELAGAVAPPQATPWVLPDEEIPMDRSDAGIDDIGSWLATPARVGAWIGHGVIRDLGRETGVPGGFGTRRLVLANQLRTAARLGELRVWTRWLSRFLTERADGYDRSPLAAWGAPWASRARSASRALESLGAAGAIG